MLSRRTAKTIRGYFVGFAVLALLAISGTLAISACGSHAPSPETSASTPSGGAPAGRRDINEMMRAKYQHRVCKVDGDCPFGTHCDDSGACTYACVSVDGCDADQACSDLGVCVRSLRRSIDINTPDCAARNPADVIAALEMLNDNPNLCRIDADCICGAYCNNETLLCQVDCVNGDTSGNLTCTDPAQTCTGIGQCIDTIHPPPTAELTLGLPLVAVSANTFAAAVLVPVTVTVEATTPSVVTAHNPHPATVRYHFVGIDDPLLPPDPTLPPPDPTSLPKVKCAEGDALASSCEVRGGWMFTTSGGLRSQERTIWVQVPQSTTLRSWTLQATSDWAADAASVAVAAAPIVPAPTIPGHYTGQMTVTIAGAPLTIPVEALVTDTNVAILDPARIFLPDAHAVLTRDVSKIAMIGWLNATVDSTTTTYNAGFHLGALVQGPTTGHIDFGASSVSIGASTPSPMALSLDRVGDIDAPACTANSTCANGTYCETLIGRCLAGSGPAAGSGIWPISDSHATPSTSLRARQVAAWHAPLAKLISEHLGVLALPGVAGISSAYCAHTQIDGSAPSFNVSFATPPDTSEVSHDSECVLAGPPYAEPTFPYAERTTEVEAGAQGGDALALLDACTAELKAPPSSALSTARCASLGRFFLALQAAGVVAGNDTQQRLIWHLVRQWLGLNAYVANTTIRTQAYQDVLAADNVAPQVRLGEAVDQVEQNLLVLIDPTVRDQWAAGSAVDFVASAPDYRGVARPAVRWAFNGQVNPVPDAEGNNPLIATGANVKLAGSYLDVSGARSNIADCHSTTPVTLDPTRYTIMATIAFVPANGQTVTLVKKDAPNGKWLKLDATTQTSGRNIILSLHDADGRHVVFEFPWDVSNGGVVAVVRNGSTFSAFVKLANQPAPSVRASVFSGAGLTWGDAGTVSLACNVPTDGTCTSWDRNFAGDALDVTTQSSKEESPLRRNTCTTVPRHGTTCTGEIASSGVCLSLASQRRTALLQTVFPNAPAAALNAFTVTGAVNTVSHTRDNDAGTITDSVAWDCALTITSFPVPATAKKPACGFAATNSIHWDEVSLWSRSVTFDEFKTMALRYHDDPTKETLPPKKLYDSQDEQGAGLPVYLIEAANAHLDLLAHYLAAENDVVYSQCYTTGASNERDIAAARVGHNLRLLAALELEAVRLAQLASPSAPWRPRYQKDLDQVAHLQNAVVQQLRRINECSNALDIGEDEIPLYVGAVSSNDALAAFYASSQYLTSLAQQEVSSTNGAATSLLSQARNAFVAQRLSSFQTNRGAGSTEKADRVNALTVNYEDQLKRFCGAAPGDLTGGHPLLDEFRAGTLNETNCFFKVEQAGCTGLEHTPFANVPDDCMRGELGERIIAIKSAAIDVANANAAQDRAIKAEDLQDQYCIALVESAAAAQQELLAHQDRMRALAKKQQFYAFVSSFVAGAETLTADFVTGGASSLIDFSAQRDEDGDKTGETGKGFDTVSTIAGFGLQYWNNKIANAIRDEQDKYEVEVSVRKSAETVLGCHNTADQQRLTIAAAGDTILRAAQESQAALFAMRDDMNTVAGLAGEAKAQIAFEDTIDRTPPQFHYWLDQDIAEYQNHMAYARRLTYLALRAYEYETQTDLQQRGAVLSARLPSDLEHVLTKLVTNSGKIAGGLDTKLSGLTLSLRDEIMKIQPVQDPTNPATILKSPKQVFNDLLRSDAAKIYTGTGANRHLLGYGIRFSIVPDQWNNLYCDERIWRVTPLPAVDGGVPNSNAVVLFHSNSFGGQSCTDAHPVTMTRLRPNANLMSGDATVDFSVPPAMFGTPITVPTTLTAAEIHELPAGNGLDASDAGRGLYGDYIFVFPVCDPTAGCTDGYTDDKLKAVTDVTIRFDVVYAANSHVIHQ
jgi:hypothetical protein